MTDDPIRLIATDIDGTLLNDRGVITPRALRAIRDARERGIAVAIASGRFAENVYVLLEQYGLRLPIIAVNGGRVVDENLRDLSGRTMTPQAAERTLDTLLSWKADYFIFGDRFICTSSPGVHHHSELSQGERMKELGFRYYHGAREAREAIRFPVYKFFVCNNDLLDEVRLSLQSIPDIDLTQSNVRNVEVMPAGVDKGLGVREMARALGVSLNQVMALGDESNDIPMLKAAFYGVAMGNGSEAAKKAARFVTAPNDQEGFAKAVEKWALGRTIE